MTVMTIQQKVVQLIPGALLSISVTAGAYVAERVEKLIFGKVWLESLVLAILLGCFVRTLWSPSRKFVPGIQFGAKTILEVAVVLLGASVSANAIMSKGLLLFSGIAGVVFIAIIASYTIGRIFRLPHRLAILVACGNSICGNSAIAATAPVIGACGEDIASSIAFTAVLGVLIVLILPLLIPLFGFSPLQYGIFAGLTVYAVPQVLAATEGVALTSVHIGTIVKLVRVLMLGPVVLILSLINGKSNQQRPPLSQLIPWFINGFLLLMILRSCGWIPSFAIIPVQSLANVLTIISMAALGLGVDLRSIAKAGFRVLTTAALSLLVLGFLSFWLIRLLNIA